MAAATPGIGLSIATLQKEFARTFAPWVHDLDLRVTRAGSDHVTLVMHPGERFNRQGGIVSGQALMAAADSAMVLAIFSACGEPLPCSSVDINTSFLKPATNVELIIRGHIIRLGRSIAFARAEIQSTADGKLVLTATGTYALPAQKKA